MFIVDSINANDSMLHISGLLLIYCHSTTLTLKAICTINAMQLLFQSKNYKRPHPDYVILISKGLTFIPKIDFLKTIPRLVTSLTLTRAVKKFGQGLFIFFVWSRLHLHWRWKVMHLKCFVVYSEIVQTGCSKCSQLVQHWPLSYAVCCCLCFPCQLPSGMFS